MLGDLRENFVIMRHPPLVHPAPEAVFDDAVNLQVGIPSDGRREVAVV